MRWLTAAQVASLRSKQRNFSKVYLFVQRGKERTSGCAVANVGGTLNVGCHYLIDAVDTYDTDEHSLTFGTAGILSGTDIRSGMTLAVGTQSDPFLYGSVRIRRVDAGSDILYLEPNNLFAEGYLIPGSYVYVDGAYRLYRKLPHIVNGVVYEDGNPDTALGAGGIPGYGLPFSTNYLDRPVALMGSPRIAWTGEYISFYGWRSYGRGGNNVTTYLWGADGGETPDGVNAAGSPDSGPVRMRWLTSGDYNVTLTVTDDSGKVGNDAYGVPFTQHTAVRPVLVRDRPGEGSDPPYTDFSIETLQGKYGSGWTAQLEVFGTADRSEFPDNALVIIYAEDWYGGMQESIGGWYGQEGILFVGYILADSVEVNFEQSTVTFEAATIERWMKDIDVWPANFANTSGVPTKWKEFQDMTLEDVLWHLAEFRSNLKDVTDCFFCPDPDGAKRVDFLDVTEASLYEQMSAQIGSCFFGEMSASRYGSIHLFKHKNMLDLSERLMFGIPVFHFQRGDWRGELKVGEERMRDYVAQVDFIGFIYDANGNPQEVYSLAPGRQTNFGKIEKVDGILLTGNTIASAQAEANTLSGLYRAWKNIRFPCVSVHAFNNRVLEPATQDYFAITLSDTSRGLNWAKKEFLCVGATYRFDSEQGTLLVEYDGEASTWGPAGVSGDYPHDDWGDDPTSDEGEDSLPEIPPRSGYFPPGGIPDEEMGGTIFFVGQGNNHLYRSYNVMDTGSAVVYEDLGALPAGVGTVRWFALDPFNPTTTGIVCGTEGSYIAYDLDCVLPATPAWSLLQSAPGTWDHFQVEWSRLQQGRFMIAAHLQGASGWIDTIYYFDNYTLSGSASLNVPTSYQSIADYPRVECSTHDADTAWCIYDRDQGDFYVAKTTNWWASWTNYAIAGWSTILSLAHRHLDNNDDNFALYGHGDVDAAPNGDAFVTRCLGDVSTCTTSGPLGADEGDETYQVGSCLWEANRYWALTGSRGAGYPATWRFHVSSNGLNWTEQIDFSPLVVRHVIDWPLSSSRFYACCDGGPIMVSTDRGASWSNKPGNWASVGGGSGSIVCGDVAKPVRYLP